MLYAQTVRSPPFSLLFPPASCPTPWGGVASCLKAITQDAVKSQMGDKGLMKRLFYLTFNSTHLLTMISMIV
jgi:hypothetical protein